jgi:hypothetical protein
VRPDASEEGALGQQVLRAERAIGAVPQATLGQGARGPPLCPNALALYGLNPSSLGSGRWLTSTVDLPASVFT